MFMAVQWIDPIKDDAVRCEATVFVGDDRWGGWTNQCPGCGSPMHHTWKRPAKLTGSPPLHSAKHNR